MAVAEASARQKAELLLRAFYNAKARSLGDLPGHEFHGNQWTGGSVADVIRDTPLNNPERPAGLLPTERAIARAVDEAQMMGNYAGKKVEVLDLSSLKVREPDQMEARPALVERYRKGWPVQPVVVNAKNEIIDGHHRVQSAIESGRTRIFVVKVRTQKIRANAGHVEGAIHAAADAHMKPMLLVVRAAFNLGRKAQRSGGDAPAAIRKALLKALPPVLLSTVKAGGEASLRKLRTMGDVPGHEFHGNQWTQGGGKEDDYMYGGCASFAVALQQEIGGQIHAAVDNEGKARHVFVVKDGKSYDAAGQRGIHVMSLKLFGTLDKLRDGGALTREELLASNVRNPTPKLEAKARQFIEKHADRFPRLRTNSMRALRPAGGDASLRKLRTMGDVVGHEFHGNQWTEGSGTGHWNETSRVYGDGNATVLFDVDGRQHLGLALKKGAGSEHFRRLDNIYDASWTSTLPNGFDKTDVVGSVKINAHGDRRVGTGLSVDKEHQRQGHATRLYNHVEAKLGKLTPEFKQTDEGKSFWKSRGAEMRTLRPQRKGQPHSEEPPFALAFNVEDPRAVAWAEEHAAELAEGISKTSRERIKDAVANALKGDGLDEAEDEIADAVGDDARAEMIARTEVMTAANEGQRQGWEQAIDAGLLPEDAKRVWIATSGCCDLCDELDGEEAEMDGEYDDGVSGPPLHPNCRCMEGLSL